MRRQKVTVVLAIVLFGASMVEAQQPKVEIPETRQAESLNQYFREK